MFELVLLLRRGRLRGGEARGGGFSLVEMVVVIALTSVLFGLVVTFLAALLRYGDAMRERSTGRMQTQRLTDAMRRDLRRTADLVLIRDETLELKLVSGQTVRYRLADRRCERSATETDGPIAESFSIGPCSRWRVDRQADSRAGFVALWIDRPEVQVPRTQLPPLWIVGSMSEAKP